jgi:beta-galactosidase/beta-glucuronidase
VWYRRTLALEAPASGERVLLHFGRWTIARASGVNGRLATEHEGGHTPFSADITMLLQDGPEQVVVVRAHDDPHDLSQAAGQAVLAARAGGDLVPPHDGDLAAGGGWR